MDRLDYDPFRLFIGIQLGLVYYFGGIAYSLAFSFIHQRLYQLLLGGVGRKPRYRLELGHLLAVVLRRLLAHGIILGHFGIQLLANLV